MNVLQRVALRDRSAPQMLFGADFVVGSLSNDTKIYSVQGKINGTVP